MVSSSNRQSRGSYQDSRRSEHGPLGEESLGSVLSFTAPQEDMFSSLNISIDPQIDTESTKGIISTGIEDHYSNNHINISPLEVDGFSSHEAITLNGLEFGDYSLESNHINSDLGFDSVAKETAPSVSALEFDFPQATQSVFAEQFQNGNRTVIKDFPLTSEE